MIDYDNPRGKRAVAITSVFTCAAFLVVVLRFYTRLCLVRYHGVEDYGVVLAMLCSIGLTVCIGFQVRWGMGQHIYELQPDTMQKSMKAFWVSLIVYYLSLGLTKISILLQYRRIFMTKKFQIGNGIVMFVVVCYAIWTIFSSIFACIPVRAFWTREPNARCINQYAMWFTNAGINILTDFAIVILPMPVIQGLNLCKRQKIALMTIFIVGGTVCIVSILRLQSLVEISNSVDPTYDNSSAATWSSVETNIGIICSCLPLLRPLLIRWLPSRFSATRYSDGSAPRLYATIGSARCRDDMNPQSGYDLKSTHSTLSQSLCIRKDKEIQVVTHVHVEVEEGRGGNSPNELKTLAEKGRKNQESKVQEANSKRQSWLSTISSKDTQHGSGTDRLVFDA